jgi:hypothetical protein
LGLLRKVKNKKTPQKQKHQNSQSKDYEDSTFLRNLCFGDLVAKMIFRIVLKS